MPDNKLALILVALSVTLLGAGDATVRLMGEVLSAGQVIALRGVILIIILSGGLLLRGYSLDRARVFHRWSVWRAIAETFTTYCFFLSLQLLPIAIATTVVFIFPVLLTLTSIIFFGERVGIFRWFAVAMGFVGVVLISSPQDGHFNLALLLPLGTAVGLVFRDFITKKIPDSINATEIILTAAIVTTGFGFMTFPFGQWGVPGIREISLLPIAAILVASSFILYVVAVRKGELSLIAPMQYLVILWATFWGILIWGEWPEGRAIEGGLLIIGSGLLILWREYVQRQRLAAS